MTNILFLGVFFLLVGACAFYTPLAILSWLWVTIQSPHQLIESPIPANLFIVFASGIAIALNRKNAQSPFSFLTIVLIIYLCHASITTFFSVMPSQSIPIWDRFWKTVVLVLVVVALMGTRTRIHAVVFILVASLGMLAVKATVFTLVTGGGSRIWGPPNSQIADNNHFGAALIMAFPFSIYLFRVTRRLFSRVLLLGLSSCFPVAALFTYSRGALVALVAVSGCYWLMSRNKIGIAIAVLAVALAALPIMPQAWLNRMSTIQESGGRETADESVQERFDSWEAHWAMAKRYPFTGGGFRTIEHPSIWVTLHESPRNRAAHNSYFQTIGEQGFIGLFLFLLLIFSAAVIALRIRLQTKLNPQLAWARELATACALAILSYSVSSIALSIATYDMFYIVIAIITCLHRLVSKEKRVYRRV